MWRNNKRFSIIVLLFMLGALLTIGCLPLYAQAPETGADTETRSNNPVTVPYGTVSRGDAVSFFDDVVVDGELHGNAVAIMGDVTVRGRVVGDVVSVMGKVTLGENAEVTGDVTAVGGGITRSSGVRIGGSVNNVSVGNFVTKDIIRVNWIKNLLRVANPLSYLFYLAGLFALALLTISLLPNHVVEVSAKMTRDTGRCALIGVLAWVLIWPLLVLTFVTIIGIPLAFLLFCAFFAAKMLGYVAIVTTLGIRILPGEDRNDIARLALGVLTLGLVRYVPIMGVVVSIVVSIVTIGAVLDTRFGTNKPWFSSKQGA